MEASTKKSNFIRLLSPLILLVLCGILIPLAVNPFSRSLAAIQGDAGYFQLDNEEGALLYQSLELAAGRTIYRPLDVEPYTVGTYPPLYLWVSGMLTDANMPGFQAGRIINLIAVFMIGFCLIAICYHRATYGLAGLLAWLLWITTFELFVWIPYYRVDLSAIAFSMAAIAVAMSPRTSAWIPIVAGIFTVAAVYCKQTAILTPVAIVVASITNHRRVKIFLATSVGLGAAIGLTIQFMTRGEFLENLVTYNVNTWRKGPTFRGIDKRFYSKVVRHKIRISNVGGLLCARQRKQEHKPCAATTPFSTALEHLSFKCTGSFEFGKVFFSV